MFEGNSLSVSYRLRDLERQFNPQFGSDRQERHTPKFQVAATLFAYVFVGLTLGTAYLA